MKKILMITLATVLVAGMIVGGMAYAGDSQPASKATAVITDVNVIKAGSYPETTIMSQIIKVPGNNKDLFVDVSLETGLYTDTVVRSKGGDKYTTTAEARIEVMVQAQMLDNQGNPVGDPIIAEPDNKDGWVVFDYRMQALSAALQGIITDINCELVDDDKDEETPPVIQCSIDPEDLEPEEIGLLLETMAAHSFNFILPDLPVGTYLIEVKAKVASATSIEQDGDGVDMGEATANATIGLGSVTIEAVRMIRGEVIEFTQP